MRRSLLRVLLGCFWLTGALGAQQPQQQQPPPPTFKVEINYVEVDASVTDAQGHFVTNLTKNDFQILEDGHPQAISAFSMVDIPVERADPPLYAKAPVPTEVVSNRRPFEGRVFVLVMDDLHTKFADTPRARATAAQFVERYVGANDLVAVVNSSGYTKAMQEFTSDRQLVLRAIDGSMGNKADSSTQAALQDYFMNRDSPGPRAPTSMNADINELERYTNARNTMRMLATLSDYLAGIRGRRKAVVYFSEGINYDVTNLVGNNHASDVKREMQNAIAAATRANVSIYSVDPRGLVSGMEDALQIGSFADDGSITSANLLEEVRLEHDSLRVLAEQTGGFAVLNQNDFRNGFARIIEDSSTYYVLGYYPANEKLDGRYRNVQVRTLGPGLTVRVRQGYTASSGGAKPPPAKAAAAEHTSPVLRDALESPLPVSGLTLSAFAAPFRGADSKDAIALSIEIDGRNLQFASARGLYDDNLELSLYAADVNGKIRDGAHDEVDLTLKPATYEYVRAGEFRIVRTMAVPPGRYQLRVGVHESGADRVGTVICDLDAPDFSKAPLTMSGIALASASLSRVPTADPAAFQKGGPVTGGPSFKDVLPAPFTASREFPRNDTLAMFSEIYDNAGSTPHEVDITASILSDDGKVMFSKADVRGSEDLHGASGGYGYTTTIPLTGFAPGRYVLRVEAKSRLGNAPAIAREVEFRVD
jgi:VWFA-related protein